MSLSNYGILVANLDSDLCGRDTAGVSTLLCKYPMLKNATTLQTLNSFCVEIRYMVDAADHDKIEASRNELHHLLDKPQLAGIPVLVLGNKRDLPNALDENGLIERM